jgi:hypothetical protein
VACGGRRAGWSLCYCLYACSQQSQRDETLTEFSSQA